MKQLNKLITGLFLKNSDQQDQAIQLWQSNTVYHAGDLV